MEDNMYNKFEHEKHYQEETTIQHVQPIQAVASLQDEVKLPDSIPINFEVNKDKSLKEQAKDIVDLAATQKAIQDESLVKNITNIKKEELTASAENSLKEEKVKSKDAEKKLQEANYGIWAGVAELIGLKKPLPNTMLQILMWVISPFIVVYYLTVGFITAIINVTMDCVNSIVTKFAEFSVQARKCIVFILITGLTIVILYTVYFFLNKYGIINF